MKTSYKKILNLNVGIALYLSTIALYYFGRIIETSEISNFMLQANTAINLVTGTALVLKITLFSQYTKTELAIAVIGCVAILPTYLITRSTSIVLTLLLLIGSFGVPLKKIAATVGMTCLFGVVLVSVSSQLGIIPNRFYESTNSLFGIQLTRRYLGFNHVNYLGGYVLIIYLCLLIRYYYILRQHLLLSSIIPAILFLINIGSRTAGVLVLVAAALMFFERKVVNRQTCFMLLFVIAVVAIILAYFTPMLFNAENSFWRSIDDLLSGRLSFGNYFLNNYPITMFGQEISAVSTIEAAESGVSALVLDSSYLNLLLRYGLVLNFLYVIIYLYGLYRSYKAQNYAAALAITVMLVCGTMESWLVSASFNVAVFALLSVNKD